MIFPALHARETIASFGYRIARLSGVTSLPELTFLLDMDLHALMRGDAVSIERFAAYARCEPDGLRQAALDASNTRRLRIGIEGGNLVASSPHVLRVCPACLEGLRAEDFWRCCLGRIDWLVDANHLCARHNLRLISLRPLKGRRVQHDLSALMGKLKAAETMAHLPETPTVLERYIADRLNGQARGKWADTVQLDVVIKTAEIFGALAQSGAGGDWRSLSARATRIHGALGAEVVLGGPEAIRSFLSEHVGRGRSGNDYRQAFGQAFEPFYSRRLQEAWLPVRRVLAEYVGENFRFTGQTAVFGVEARGLPPATLRALCDKHGIGVKITAQVLKAKYGHRFGLNDMTDPKLIEEIAPLLRDQMNAQDAARYLGVSIEVLQGFVADGLLTPDFRFNERLIGFLPTTLDRFLREWCVTTSRRRGPSTPLMVVARAHRVRTSQLLLAARALNTGLTCDRRRRGFASFAVSDSEIPQLLARVKSQPDREHSPVG